MSVKKNNNDIISMEKIENLSKNISDLINLGKYERISDLNKTRLELIKKFNDKNNKVFYDLINKFYEITNCPMLVNNLHELLQELVISLNLIIQFRSVHLLYFHYIFFYPD